MSEMLIRQIEHVELNAALVLEQKCYSPDAAATMAGFQFRFEHYHSFFWSAWIDDQLVGITNGIRTDQMSCGDEMKGAQVDRVDGNNLCILTIAVEESYRSNQIGVKLLRKLIEVSQSNGIQNIILMCEEHLISFYESEQFELKGISDSKHGGIVWYEMIRVLHTM